MKTVFCLLAAWIAFKLLLPASTDSILKGFSFSQRIYDENHQLLRITLSKDDKYRIYTPLNDISPILIEATLLQEDRYFFRHPGFNPIALIKAAWQTYFTRSRPMGASTITMQLARLLHRINTRKPAGKILQIIKAMELELLYSKEQILEAYLNLISYGGNIEGIGAASMIYLNKQPDRLNLPEALELCIIPQNPLSRNFQESNKAKLQKARDLLFARWIADHPEDEHHRTLLNLPLQFHKKNLPFFAPHFVDQILSRHRESCVISSLNLELQTLIENTLCRHLEKHRENGVQNAAVMLADIRDCKIKALIGSGNYFEKSIHGQVNGTLAKRSPGSTLKPFIYALAIDQGMIHPCSILEDSPCRFSDYKPENFERDFLGPLKAKEALALSRNIPALHLVQQLKSPTLYEFLKQTCATPLKPEASYGLSLALGSCELTMEELAGLYAMLANRGEWRPLSPLKKDAPVKGKFLLSPEACFITLDMLRDTPRPLTSPAFPQQVYWKTGTSSGLRDGWTLGIFGPYVLAVWVGDFSNQNRSAYTGMGGAAPLFFSIADAISSHAGPLPDPVQATPDLNLAKIKICDSTGLLPNSRCPHLVTTWFIPGKSPIKKDTLH